MELLQILPASASDALPLPPAPHFCNILFASIHIKVTSQACDIVSLEKHI